MGDPLLTDGPGGQGAVTCEARYPTPPHGASTICPEMVASPPHTGEAGHKVLLFPACSLTHSLQPGPWGLQGQCLGSVVAHQVGEPQAEKETQEPCLLSAHSHLDQATGAPAWGLGLQPMCALPRETAGLLVSRGQETSCTAAAPSHGHQSQPYTQHFLLSADPQPLPGSSEEAPELWGLPGTDEEASPLQDPAPRPRVPHSLHTLCAPRQLPLPAAGLIP